MKILLSDLTRAQVEGIEGRMRPGVASGIGFLDARERLLEVVRRDYLVCRRLGISPTQIADRMESIVGKAYRLADLARRGKISLPLDAVRGMTEGHGTGIVVEERFCVTGQHWLGVQECPFEDQKGEPCKSLDYANADLCIENLDPRSVVHRIQSWFGFRDSRVVFPGLAIHLIRDHHFFEGSVRYRVDPGNVAAVLEIEVGVDYAPRRATEATWRFIEGTGDAYDSLEPVFREHFGRCMNDCDEVIELAEGVRIYVKGDTCSVIAEREHALGEGLVVRGAEWGAPVIHRGTSVCQRFQTSYVVP